MGYQVLLRSIPTNGYIATALAWPQCTVEAPTREEALEKMRTAIAELFSGGEIVEVEVPAACSQDRSDVRGDLRHVSRRSVV